MPFAEKDGERKMKIEEDGTVVFKSTPYYFKEERDGLKPNTVRLLTRDEKREIETTVRVNKIRIEPTMNYEIKTHDVTYDTFQKLTPFTRTITSIEQIGALCGYYLFVFSWRHEERVKDK